MVRITVCVSATKYMHLSGATVCHMAAKRPGPKRRKKPAPRRRRRNPITDEDLHAPARSVLAGIIRIKRSLADETAPVARRRLRRILNRVYLAVRWYRETLEIVAVQAPRRARPGLADQIRLFTLLEAEFRTPLRERSN